MLDDYMSRITAFRSAVSIAQKLLVEKLITKLEYNRIVKLLRKKYSVNQNSIFQ